VIDLAKRSEIAACGSEALTFTMSDSKPLNAFAAVILATLAQSPVSMLVVCWVS
jgi:hypothetical protein